MFTKKALISHQEFLTEQGLYAGEIDGFWGPQSVNAMIGFSFRSSAGNADGQPFTSPPKGYSLAEGVLIKSDEEVVEGSGEGSGEGQEVDQNQEAEQQPTTETNKFQVTGNDKPEKVETGSKNKKK